MKCSHQSQLSDYLDGESAGAREIEAHLLACASCRAHLNELRNARESVRHALDSYPRVRIENPQTFDARVLNAVMSRRNRRSSLDVFIDRLETIFARPLWKLLGSLVSGTLFGLMLVAVIVPRGADKADDATSSASLSPGSSQAKSNQFYALNGWRRDASSLELLREMEIEGGLEATPRQRKQTTHELKPPREPKPPRALNPPRASQFPHLEEPSWDAGLSTSPRLRSPFSSSPGPLC